MLSEYQRLKKERAVWNEFFILHNMKCQFIILLSMSGLVGLIARRLEILIFILTSRMTAFNKIAIL